MGWLANRRLKKEQRAGVAIGLPGRDELERRPLADLRGYASKLGVKRYRMLRREALLDTLAEYAGQTNGDAPERTAGPRRSRPRREAGGRPARQPRREPKPEPKDEPQPEPQTYQATGVVDIGRRGHGFLRIDGLARSKDDPYVSRSQISKLELRSGDMVAAEVRSARRSERYPSVIRIETVEGDPAEADRPELLEDTDPASKIELLGLSSGADDVAGRMIELVAPIGVGQCGLVVAPPGAGATTLLRGMADALSARSAEIFAVLVDARPEELAVWPTRNSVTIHASQVGDQPGAQIGMAELAIERARRLAERGAMVVVLLDSATHLARARASGRSIRGAPDESPIDRAVQSVKRLFVSAHASDQAGSLTIIASIQSGSDGELEEGLYESLSDAADAEIVLDADLARDGLFPAIDADSSRARSEEALIAEQDRHRLQALRSVVRSLEPRDAWEFLAAKLRETHSNDELLRD